MSAVNSHRVEATAGVNAMQVIIGLLITWSSVHLTMMCMEADISKYDRRMQYKVWKTKNQVIFPNIIFQQSSQFFLPREFEDSPVELSTITESLRRAGLIAPLL